MKILTAATLVMFNDLNQNFLVRGFHYFLLLFFLTLSCSTPLTASLDARDKELKESKESIGKRKTKKKKLIKILSIDGGGIRGIIPTLVLKELESKLKNKRHLAECFDIMAGTSTGGIIVLLLNTPGIDGKPKYQTSDIVALYTNFGDKAFYQTFWQSLINFGGWFGEKYSSRNLEQSFEEYFGETRLRHSITNVLIPAYEISKDDTIFFKTDKARLDLGRDFYFKDIARATSAAPTYFTPAHIQDIAGKVQYTLIDGGVAVNNPTMSACVYALKLFGRDNDFLVISLGTGTNYGAPQGQLSYKEHSISGGGKLEWAPEMVSMMMYASNEIVDYQMTEVFRSNESKKEYYRFQILLASEHTEMDDTRPENIKALEDYGKEVIQTYQQELSIVASILDSN